jgi:hypothetical protein
MKRRSTREQRGEKRRNQKNHNGMLRTCLRTQTQEKKDHPEQIFNTSHAKTERNRLEDARVCVGHAKGLQNNVRSEEQRDKPDTKRENLKNAIERESEEEQKRRGLQRRCERTKEKRTQDRTNMTG